MTSPADRWPVDPRTGQPLPPRAQPGYYPGYDTLSQQDFWDEATRRVVLARVHDVPPIRFFSAEQARLLDAICERVLPQDDRDEAHRVPIVNAIDDRLFSNRGYGYRYEHMPHDREAYRLGLEGIEAIARHLSGRPFLELQPIERDRVLKTLHDGRPPSGDAWQRMPAERFWLLLMHDVCTAYYAHPYAWNEIGFGGPAYPRAYFRLENGEPEPWEVRERRYDWQPPPSSLSGRDELVAGTTEHRAQPGQGGTH